MITHETASSINAMKIYIEKLRPRRPDVMLLVPILMVSFGRIQDT